MRRYKKILKNILLAVLIAFITYYGGGEQYIKQGVNYVGERIAVLITGEPYDVKAGAEENRLRGKVVQVSDGDTVILQDEDGEKHKIRLNGIDAPEIGQDYGDEARDFVKMMVLNSKVSVEVVGRDQYDRVLGVLYVGATNVNEELLGNGLAWQYRFNKDVHYTQLVLEAKIEGLNIWSDVDPEDPYVWRKKHIGISV